MRILITGGTGFLGSALARRAIQAGHEVAVMARSRSDALPPGIPFLQGEMATPPWNEIRMFAPEACVHTAWIATPGIYLNAPENPSWARWSLDFLRELRRSSSCHLTVLGTCIEYQMTGQRFQEDRTPLAPASPYAQAKCQLHRWLQDDPVTASGPLAWARIFYPYGEGEHPGRLPSSVIRQLREGKKIQLRTPHSVKDYIHVQDVSSALLTLINQQFSGSINIGTGQGVRVGTLVQKLANLLGRGNALETPSDLSHDPLDDVVADNSRLQSLGWAQEVGLDNGLQRMIENLKP